ncbi:MAG: tRNA 2-thiocytidine(32) synthetase TtcA, partial [Burkholderiales bacterium]|nr:tRNA 2-thiocytidine(32) synthetase TtcA [Burkholderiales bacterium]
RKQVGAMLQEWDRRFPGRLDNMLHALQNVVPSHLADPALYDFKGLVATGEARPDGDRAFDPEEFPSAGALPTLQVIRI